MANARTQMHTRHEARMSSSSCFVDSVILLTLPRLMVNVGATTEMPFDAIALSRTTSELVETLTVRVQAWVMFVFQSYFIMFQLPAFSDSDSDCRLFPAVHIRIF
jgi:hypothetical protein